MITVRVTLASGMAPVCRAAVLSPVFMSSDGCEEGTEASTCRPDGTGGTGEGREGCSEELRSTALVFSKWYLGRGKHPPLPPASRVLVIAMESRSSSCLPPLLALVVTGQGLIYPSVGGVDKVTSDDSSQTCFLPPRPVLPRCLSRARAEENQAARFNVSQMCSPTSVHCSEGGKE